MHVYPLVVSAATNGNNSETRSGRDFSDNGGIGIVPSRVPPPRVTAADAGALEINFGLMPRQRHRRESLERRDDEFRRDVIFPVSIVGFLEQAIKASLAAAAIAILYTFRITVIRQINVFPVVERSLHRDSRCKTVIVPLSRGNE